MRCPGQDMRFWKPGDIFDAPCPQCGGRVEFFKDEVRRKCRCGHLLLNPKLDFGCAEWCPYAEQCVGTVPEEVNLKRQSEQRDLLKERISLEMKNFYGPDLKKVVHALKVAGYAEKILKQEGGHPLVVIGAAYLHDVGVKQAESVAGDPDRGDAGSEGRDLTHEILNRLDVGEETVEEIGDLIDHFHNPDRNETLNVQILCDAECLAHLEDADWSKGEGPSEASVEGAFWTLTGKGLARRLWQSKSSHQG